MKSFAHSHTRGLSLQNICEFNKRYSKDFNKPFDEKEFNEKSTIIHYNPNEIYDGFVNEKNEPHGFGNLFFSNNDYYFGQFKNGKREGNGTYTYAKDNSVYDGFWKNDMKEGNGAFTNNNTNTVYNVVYKEDKLMDKPVCMQDIFFNSSMRGDSRNINTDFIDFDGDSSNGNTSLIMNNNNETVSNLVSPQKNTTILQRMNTSNRKLSHNNESTYSTIDME